MARGWRKNNIGFRFGFVLIVGILLAMQNFVRSSSAEALTASQFESLSEQEFSDWMTYYYQAPQPELVPSFIRRASALGFLKREQTLPPLAGFLARTFATHPESRMSVLSAAKSLPSRDYQTVLATVILAADSDKVMVRDVVAQLDDYGNNLMSWFWANGIYGDDRVEPISPSALDFIWGSFMAAGEANLVVPLIGVIAPPKEHKDLMTTMVSAAANWSLSSNARQHPKIMELCKQQAAKQPPDIAAKLREIVEQK